MSRFALLPVALLAVSVAAQTSTDCNPLNVTCPDNPALGTSYNVTFDASTQELNSALWNVTAGKPEFTEDGLELTIYEDSKSFTAESTFYIFWGTVEVLMKAASGQGIISTMVLLSDDLDEIDLECFGTNTTHVDSNWYGHGDTNQFNGGHHPVDGPQDGFHNYTYVWGEDKLEWYIDGTVVRTLDYAPSGQYPQTPSQLKFGIWAGGDSESEGTVNWAGGKTNWDEGPFTMHVKSVKVTDGHTNVTSYAYGDHSGSSDSITIETGESDAYQFLNQKSTTEKAEEKWKGLSTGAKIGIACGVIAGVAIGIIAWCTFCIFQRRKGKKERQLADAEWDKDQAELQTYQEMMRKGQFAVSSTAVPGGKF